VIKMRYEKPLPQPTPISKKYWEGLRNHKLLLQRCRKCGISIFYPRKFCPNCLSEDLEWFEARGKGKLHSFTVVYSTGYPEFRKDVPFIIGFVRLEEGVSMISNIVGCELSDLKVDMDVEVVFDDVTEEFTLPKFKPVKGEKSP
jgi:uncharacterized OB-fold protein